MQRLKKEESYILLGRPGALSTPIFLPEGIFQNHAVRDKKLIAGQKGFSLQSLTLMSPDKTSLNPGNKPRVKDWNGNPFLPCLLAKKIEMESLTAFDLCAGTPGL